jgi:hypothetical protein
MSNREAGRSFFTFICIFLEAGKNDKTRRVGDKGNKTRRKQDGEMGRNGDTETERFQF